MPNRTGSKRPYLRSEDRRQALLRAASTIVDREGLANLTMVGVADEAGISRQLVYRHFEDLDALLIDLLRSRFAAMDESFEHESQLAADAAGFVEGRVRAAMAMPAEDHRLIRSVFGDLANVRPELVRTVSVLRQRLIERYAALIDGGAGSDALTRATVWALVNALFGLWELYDDGSIDLEEAVRIFLALTPGRGDR